MFENLNAWQMLLWIAGLEIISAPIIVTVANSIANGYFRAKEAHAARITKAFGTVLEKIGNSMSSKSSVDNLKEALEKLEKLKKEAENAEQ